MPRDAPLTRPRTRLAWEDAKGAHTVVIDHPMTVGLAAKADVVVDDSTVSRLHAELDPRHDGVWVRDLGSMNGTFVGDVLVTGARVPASGRVRVGRRSSRCFRKRRRPRLTSGRKTGWESS